MNDLAGVRLRYIGLLCITPVSIVRCVGALAEDKIAYGDTQEAENVVEYSFKTLLTIEVGDSPQHLQHLRMIHHAYPKSCPNCEAPMESH